MSSNAEVPTFEDCLPGRRRHYTAEQKRALLDECTCPGSSISIVAPGSARGEVASRHVRFPSGSCGKTDGKRTRVGPFVLANH
jgi:hypothetical protein